jgi:hypothetical protein
LQKILLVLNNHPPIIIHEEDKKDYCDALEAWDRNQNLKELTCFLEKQCVKTWLKQINKSK